MKSSQKDKIRNKKGMLGLMLGLMFLIIFLTLGYLLLYPLFEQLKNSDNLKSQSYCEEHLDNLTCEQINECYRNCENQQMINWIQACRGSFLPEIIKCNGNNQTK